MEVVLGHEVCVCKVHTRSLLFTIFCFSRSVHCWRAGPTVKSLEGRGILTLSLINCGYTHSLDLWTKIGFIRFPR